MAKVNVRFNYKQVANKLNLNMKIGYKKVTLRNADLCIEGLLIDHDTEFAQANWITTRRGAPITYKEIAAMLENTANNTPMIDELTRDINEIKVDDKNNIKEVITEAPIISESVITVNLGTPEEFQSFNPNNMDNICLEI